MVRSFDANLIEEFVPYDGHKPGRKNAVIVDLDGTIANHDQRHWAHYHLVDGDSPIWDVIEAVQHEFDWGNAVIFMSGREDSCFELTRDWICKHFNWEQSNVELYMRETGDHRADFVVKNELFDRHILGKYNVKRCYDDRDQVVALWREKGLTCFQVNYGAF